jgi:hypothetical protein
MTRTPAIVELPVCPTCGRVGKLPVHITRRDWCNGGLGDKHHRAIKMVPRVFVERLDSESELAA